jgi:hypothetical protein
MLNTPARSAMRGRIQTENNLVKTVRNNGAWMKGRLGIYHTAGQLGYVVVQQVPKR